MARDDAAAHALAVPLALPHAVSPAALHACVRCRARRRERGGTVQGLGSAGTRANRGSVRNCVCALPCKQPSVRGVQHTGRPKPWVCRVGLPSQHRVGAACRLQPPCSLPALGGVLRPPSLSASDSENRRSYELGHYRQSRLTVCPNGATTGSDPSAADCRPRCRWPLPC